MTGALLTAGAAPENHTVEPGETLEDIAQRHETTVSALRRANDLADPNRIVAGSTLSIPGATGGGAGSGGHHVVRPGESLAMIGSRYGVTARQLADWNGLASRHHVKAGQRLNVGGPAARNVASRGGGEHRVAPGQTLSGIAQRFGVGVDRLAEANGIADPDRILPGSTLAIPGGWHCPVRGSARWVNDFGIAKPGGRFHNGVDLYAARGTRVVAPVPGRVEHVRGERAGLQFRLHGVDGHVYIGTHLDSLAVSGRVETGQTLGTVGTTGNARGTSPHLHFEIHADGDQIINPYPSLRDACG
ncbi:LysM peptidoglycan-binding domain-containing M23 family metallopeptidase [Egibacter rhizosphaerae]|uniref:LysM peptidoglycan-binding domain-containing M23 family metallopeptidase n=1 Tax=Egibacter rhizosphaerae TaxID=1670831 RepID=UPI0013F168D2|nr:LysM peptidoglycan-binding domain-containing M23 family metallopeptidase [Egibacter rhizosphaerae]